jgi:magnesium transporter
MTEIREASPRRHRVPVDARRRNADRTPGHSVVKSPRTRGRRPPVGAVPGTLQLPSGAPPPVLHVLCYDVERVEERTLERVEDLAPLLAVPDRVLWIDVSSFGDGLALERLRDVLGIHPLAMADVVNVPQRPKADVYGDRLLFVAQMAHFVGVGEGEGTRELEIEQLSLVLGPGFVATFQERPGDVFDPVRARIRAGAGRIRRQGADYLAYALLDAIIDGYFPVVEAAADALEEIEEQVVAQPVPATLAEIHGLRRLFLELHRIGWAHRDALAALVRDEEAPISEPVRVYLRDVYDHAYQALDAVESARELAASLIDLQLSSASHRTNQVMQALTVVSTIFIPLTFIVGVYGMNFDVMPELHWRWSYFVLWGFMLTVAGGLVQAFRRRGWIGSPPRARLD